MLGERRIDMFCPEDGAEIPYPDVPGSISVVEYPPCSRCRQRYIYDGEQGIYRVKGEDIPPPGAHIFGSAEDLLAAEGRARRDMGVEALVANIIDTMERSARRDGQCTYYTGTYAVARNTIVNAGITCEMVHDEGPAIEPSMRWVSFFGDDWEVLPRVEITKHLLAERS